MDANEANKIIAEYMGWELGPKFRPYGDYVRSLDALVPVVKKVKAELISEADLYNATRFILCGSNPAECLAVELAEIIKDGE